MSGGYGGIRWGFGPWGNAEFFGQLVPGIFQSPIYPLPLGRKFVSTAVTRFTGEPSSGPLSGAAGLLFFSPSLLGPSSVNSVDFASVSVSSDAGDTYYRPEERSGRLFRFGGGPGFGASNLSRTNNNLYRAQPAKYPVVATLIQTTPPGPTTVIKIF